MECTVSWTGGAGTRSGMGFVAETGSGHVLTMDGAPDARRRYLLNQCKVPSSFRRAGEGLYGQAVTISRRRSPSPDSSAS